MKLGEHLRALPGPVLITGHTGFKGTWLTFLLEHLGIPTVGYSLAPKKDSLYDRAHLIGKIPELFADIRDVEALRKFLTTYKPSAIIHMAAQPLVLESYKTPRETFDVNVMGTVNILDEAFATDYIKAVIVVTTDKVYRNDNAGRTFTETDPLEGKDPYSASKVGVEAVVSAWQQIKKISGGPSVVSVRAGNVIGGGDWAKNRLIPDLVRGLLSGNPIEIRNPKSTRPWQHVLDPLHGYLLTLEKCLNESVASAYNFGPLSKNLSVEDVIKIANESYKNMFEVRIIEMPEQVVYESIKLNLDASLAIKELNWRSLWSQEDAVKATIQWWVDVSKGVLSEYQACKLEIDYLMIMNSHKKM